jgi:allophanate hydrolase subunit 1
LLLGGIAYATIHYMNDTMQKEKQETVASANAQPATPNAQFAKQADAVQTPVVYKDAELSTILNDIATFYQVETVYKNEEVKHVRLYFTWNKQQTIDEVIDMFNKFERFHMMRDNRRVIVE